MDYHYYMSLALEQAKKAYENREVPIGCVIVYKDKVIGEGCNLRVTNGNSLHHAEIIAINQACNYMQDWRLEECTLFVTVEPCPMCAGAILQARIPTVIFGTRNSKAGCCGSIMNLLQNSEFNHQTEIIEGIMQEECSQLMKSFFKDFRHNPKQGVIFDFDGTIADSTYLWIKVDEEFFKNHGMEIPPDYEEKISTLNFRQGAEFTKHAYNIEESIEEIMEQWHKLAIYEYENNVTIKPYAVEYIKILHRRGVKIGLATASNPEFYMPVLKKYDIDKYFHAFVDGSYNLPSKDEPDIYLKCAEKMGVSPENCTVYEDIIKGVKSAKKAGMRVVGVYDTRNEKNNDEIKNTAHKYIYSFKEEMGSINKN